MRAFADLSWFRVVQIALGVLVLAVLTVECAPDVAQFVARLSRVVRGGRSTW